MPGCYRSAIKGGVSVATLDVLKSCMCLLQECKNALKEASKVLQRESPLQDEYHVGLQAEAELAELSSLLLKFH